MQVFISMLSLRGGIYDFIAALDFGILGYLIVALFLCAWASSVAVWKFGHVEERFASQSAPHSHAHAHAAGAPHTHQHLHTPPRGFIGLK
jgi:high-affinity nickel-transport protein